MLGSREWAQVCTAVAAVGGYSINGQGFIRIDAVLNILSAFAVDGCEAKMQPDGTLKISAPAESKEAP